MHQVLSRALTSSAMVVGIIGSVATPAVAQQSTWRDRACSAYTTRVNARDWQWIVHHSTPLGLRQSKAVRAEGRFSLGEVYRGGPDKAKCWYGSGWQAYLKRIDTGRIIVTDVRWVD